MKGFYKLAAVFAIVSLLGCQNEENINGTSGNSIMLVDASLEVGSSRTSLEGDKNNVVWEEGDAINAYLGSTKSYQGIIKEGVGETFARFSIKTDGDLDLGGGTETDGTVFHNVAYYPYMEKGVSLQKDGDSYKISTSFSSTQFFRNNSFGKGVAHMVAVSQGFNFPFKNVGSIIKLKVTGVDGSKITRVTLQTKDGEGNLKKIAGNCMVTMTLSGTPTIVFNEDAETAITLDCGEGVELNASEQVVFVFVVPPMQYEAGNLIATFYDDNQGSMEWKAPRPFNLERSKSVFYDEIIYQSTETVNEAKLIQQAIENGQSSYTLMNDVTINNEADKINIPKGSEFTLDLGGRTITSSIYNAFENNGNLILLNGKIDPVDGEEGRRCITNNKNATLTIQNVEVVQNYNGRNSAISNYGYCSIEDATIISDSYCIWNEGEMVVNGGIFDCKSNEQTDDTPAYLINNTNKGKITINNGTFNCTHGAITTNGGAETIVNGGQFNRTTPDGIVTTSHAFYVEGSDSKLTVNDCKVKWSEIGGGCILCTTETAAIANVNFYGGLYNSQKVNSQYVITWQESGNAEYPYQVIDGGWKQVDETNYEIYNANGLKWFRNQVNGGNSFKDKIVTLTADIDLKNEGWEPIGTLNPKHYFKGTFDGGNKTISNLKVDVKDGAAGLFGAVENCISIKNVTVIKAEIKSNHYAGAIVGWLQENGSKNVPTISNCTVKQATITVTPNNGDNGDKAGAIVGYAASETKIDGCTTYDVQITGYRDLGGIVGMANSTEKNGYVTISNNKLMLTTITYSAEGAYQGTPTTFGEIYGRGDANVSNNMLSKVTVNWPEEVCAFIGGKGYLSINDAVIAVSDGGIVKVKEGEFGLPSQIGDGKTAKSVTIKGAGMDKTQLKGACNPSNNNQLPGNYAHNMTLKFEDITFTTVNDGYQGGFGHTASVEFTNCKVVGQFYAHSGAPHKFTNCTIDPLNGYLYTYASDCEFYGCKFEASLGKALQVYAEAPGTFTTKIEESTFTANKQASTWDGNPVTGIDVNSANGAVMIVYINNCTTTGFPTGLNSGSKLWNVKSTSADIKVYVNEMNVWPGYEKVGDNEYNVFNAKGLSYFADRKLADVTLNILNDIDFNGAAEFKAIAAAYGKTLTINGNGKTIKNVKVVSGTNDNSTGQASLFYTYTGSTLTINNLKVDGIEVEADINGSGYAGAIVGYAEGKVVLNNVDVNKADVYGEKSCAVLVGFVPASSELVQMTDCDVDNSKVEAKEDRTGAYVGRSIGVTKIVNCTVDNNFISIAPDGWNNKYIGQRYESCSSLTIDGNEYVDAKYGLTAAISKATSGATILVAGGTYEGLMDVSQKSLNLVAFDGTPEFNGLVWADNCTVTLKGFKLSNPDGVKHPNPSNSQYYTTINNQYPLIGAYLSSNITMEDCTFDIVGPTVYGFYGYAANKPVFKNCTFNCNGIRPIASNGPALTITGCTFNDQYHYSARIYENSGEKQTIVYTNNTVQGSNTKGEFEGINISKKASTATVVGDFTIKDNTPDLKYRHHKDVTMSESCTYDTDIIDFKFEKEQ